MIRALRLLDQFIVDKLMGSLLGGFMVILALCVALVLLIAVPILLIAGDGGHAEFMAECQAQRPKYECTAMWRAGASGGAPVVVPMPIVIPSR